MDTAHAIDALRSLTPDAIRARLVELDAEAQQLRTLLRAALAKQRARERGKAIMGDSLPEAHR